MVPRAMLGSRGAVVAGSCVDDVALAACTDSKRRYVDQSSPACDWSNEAGFVGDDMSPEFEEFRPGGRWVLVTVFTLLGLGAMISGIGALSEMAAIGSILIVVGSGTLLLALSIVQSGIVVTEDGRVCITSVFFVSTTVDVAQIRRVEMAGTLLMMIPLRTPVVVFEVAGREVRRAPFGGSPTWSKDSAAMRARRAIEEAAGLDPDQR